MTIKLISRKIREPELPYFHIIRKELNQAFSDAFEQNKKSIFLSGITGFGKTVAVRDFLHQEAIKDKFWYNLDEWDKDPVTFLNYLYQMFFLKQLISDDLEELLSQQLNNERQIKNFIVLLSNELDENLKEPCYLVMDNFQEVQDDETIQQIIVFLINYCPEKLRIILISQEQMPEVFYPFLLKHEIELLSVNDLLLKENEAQELIVKIGRNNEALCNEIINISQKNISLFILMAQKIDNQITLDNYSENRLLSNSINLIISQIYKTLSEEVKNVINQILFLPKISTKVLTFILKNNNYSIKILKESNILIFNAEEEDYSFNSVFIPYLTENFYSLDKEYQESTIKNITDSLNDIEPELLMSILFKVKAFDKIIALLSDNYEYYFRNYLYNTLEHLIQPLKEVFPDSQFLNYLQIRLYRLTGKLKKALELLEKISANPKTDQILLEEGICQSACGYYQVGIKILSTLEKENTLNKTDKLSLINCIGILYMNLHELDLAKNQFIKAIEMKDTLVFQHDLLKIYHNLGLVSTWMGDFKEALLAYQQALTLAHDLKILPFSATYNNVAIIHNFQGEYDKAYQSCLTGLEVVDKINNEPEKVQFYLTLADCYSGLKNNYKLQECLTYLDTTLEKWLTPISKALLFKLKALISVDNKEFEKAKENIFTAMNLRNTGEGDPNLLEYKLELAYIYYAESSYQAAITELNNIEQGIKEGKHLFHLARLYVYQALSYQELKEVSNFEKAKALALELINEKNYFNLATKLNLTQEKEISIIKEHPLKIYTFGELEVNKDEKSITKKGWQGKNTKLLFVYFLLNKNGVTKEQIYNVFFPEGDKSRSAFHMLIKRLRDLFISVFEDTEIISFSNDLYKFNFSVDYWWDAAQFEYQLNEAKNFTNIEERIEKTVSALSLYKGHFMAGMELDTWVFSTQEYYRNLAYKNFIEVCTYYFEKEAFENLLEISTQFFELDTCNEKACQFKLKALVYLGRKNEALQLVSFLEKNMKKVLGDEPSFEFYTFKKQLFENFELNKANIVTKNEKSLLKEWEEKAKLEQELHNLKKTNQELTKLATSDGLTNVANRRHFDDTLQKLWLELEEKKQPLSLILFDVDYFKRYNDFYGHQAGDECLIQIAQAGKMVINTPHDLFARYGGEEFVAILANTTQEEAIETAEKLRTKVSNLYIDHSMSDKQIVTISLGVATLIPSSEQDSSELLLLADKALYESKSKGRNCYSISKK